MKRIDRFGMSLPNLTDAIRELNLQVSPLARSAIDTNPTIAIALREAALGNRYLNAEFGPFPELPKTACLSTYIHPDWKWTGENDVHLTIVIYECNAIENRAIFPSMGTVPRGETETDRQRAASSAWSLSSMLTPFQLLKIPTSQGILDMYGSPRQLCTKIEAVLGIARPELPRPIHRELNTIC